MRATEVDAFVVSVVGLLLAGAAQLVALRRARAAERSAAAAEDSATAANVGTRNIDTAE